MIMNLDKILKEKFTHPCRKGYITERGYTLSEYYSEIKNDIDNLEVNEEDVWICSFPKTGTTWTQEMVWMITNNLDFEKGQVDLDFRSPFVEFSIIFDTREILKIDSDYTPPPFILDSVGYYKSVKSPKVVKTHLPYDLLPKQIITGAKKPKIIYVARDAKDTCVSYYHHCRFLEGYRGTFEEFCELFLGGKVLFGPYSNHILSYWQQRHLPNLLLLKYEDMKKDLTGNILKVATFLNRELNENQVKILTQHLSFETMKKNPAVSKNAIEVNRRWNLMVDPEGKFMRSGNVGDHKKIMNEEMNRRFDEWSEKINGTDYIYS